MITNKNQIMIINKIIFKMTYKKFNINNKKMFNNSN